MSEEEEETLICEHSDSESADSDTPQEKQKTRTRLFSAKKMDASMSQLSKKSKQER